MGKHHLQVWPSPGYPPSKQVVLRCDKSGCGSTFVLDRDTIHKMFFEGANIFTPMWWPNAFQYERMKKWSQCRGVSKEVES